MTEETGAPMSRRDTASPPDEEPPTDTGDDTGSDLPVLTEGVAFLSAELTPPFQHGNAAWAGAALLDYDMDGWLDIYLTNGESQPNALYRNEGTGRFRDHGDEAGVAMMERTGPVTSGDLDNDGDPDLVVGIECSLGTLSVDGSSLGDGGLVVLLNQGDGTFTEHPVTLPDDVVSRGMCPVSLGLVDWNGDGVLDLSSSNGIDPDQVYPWKFGLTAPEATDVLLLGDGLGGFGNQITLTGPSEQQISFSDNPERCTEGCSTTTFTSVFMDVNNDGKVDRISGEGGRSLQVFLQQEDGSQQFISSRTYSGVGQWMGIAVGDFDGDDDFDLYSTNQGLSPLVVGYDNIPPVNEAVWVNPFHSVFEWTDDEKFVERTDWSTLIEHPQGPDAFIPFEDFETGELTYAEWFPLDGLQRFPWGWGAVALDADLDGWTDVAFTGNNCSAPMAIIWDEARGAGPGGLLLNQAGAGFKDAIIEWEIPNLDSEARYQDGRGIATGDLNNDGIADLVFANRSYNPTQSDPLAQEPGIPNVWLSKPRDGHWLRVDLQGTTSNRDAIGAKVSVDLGTRSVHRMLGAGGETNSANERTVLIGTGDATNVDITVLFPSGVSTRLSDVAVDQTVVVVEP